MVLHNCPECTFCSKWSYNINRHLMNKHLDNYSENAAKYNPNAAKYNPIYSENAAKYNRVLAHINGAKIIYK